MLEQQPSLPLPTSRGLWLCPETRLRLPTGHLVQCAQEAMVRVTPPEHSTKAEPPRPGRRRWISRGHAVVFGSCLAVEVVACLPPHPPRDLSCLICNGGATLESAGLQEGRGAFLGFTKQRPQKVRGPVPGPPAGFGHGPPDHSWRESGRTGPAGTPRWVHQALPVSTVPVVSQRP